MIVIISLLWQAYKLIISTPNCDTEITKQTKLQIRDLFVMNDY